MLISVSYLVATMHYQSLTQLTRYHSMTYAVDTPAVDIFCSFVRSILCHAFLRAAIQSLLRYTYTLHSSSFRTTTQDNEHYHYDRKLAYSVLSSLNEGRATHELLSDAFSAITHSQYPPTTGSIGCPPVFFSSAGITTSESCPGGTPAQVTVRASQVMTWTVIS